MSKRKILRTVLAALSLMFLVVKTIEKMGKQPEPDGKIGHSCDRTYCLK